MRLSRVVLAISHADADSLIHEGGTFFESSVFPIGGLSDSWVRKEVVSAGPGGFATSELFFRPDDLPPHAKTLYNHAKHQGVWDDMVKHPFPDQMAKGTASLNAFRHYMIQDAKYLEYYVRARMQSIANSESKVSFKEIVGFAETLSKSVKHFMDLRNICTQQLGVPENVVDEEGMSTELENSIKLYESVVKDHLGDWLAMHIVFLPCIMGYYAIASELLEREKIVTNTPYYPLWIQANAGAHTFKKYISFINEHIEKRNPTQEEWDYWKKIFTEAYGTEKAFFDLGLKDSEYDVVHHGVYTIRSHNDRRFLSLKSDSSNEVVMQESPGLLGLWALQPTNKGYDIISQKHDTSLVAAITENFPSYCEVKCIATHEPQWSINPVKGSGYQLLWSPQLQYALSVDISGRKSKVIATNNYKGTDQLWIISAHMVEIAPSSS